MSMLNEARLVFVDVETTGFSPACGDRVVEIAAIACQGPDELARLARLVNPERAIPEDARRVHGIGDEQVAAAPLFAAHAAELSRMLEGAIVVGHCVRFDAGFLAMELAVAPGAHAGSFPAPAACLDTCQLAAAVWEMPNYRLDTVAEKLGIRAEGAHRAERDAETCRAVFSRIVQDLGGWSQVELEELLAMQAYPVAWPADPRGTLPPYLYDALASGCEVNVGYISSDGRAAQRTIRPLACFCAGRYTYLRAWCMKANELRTFRLDRMLAPAGS